MNLFTPFPYHLKSICQCAIFKGSNNLFLQTRRSCVRKSPGSKESWVKKEIGINMRRALIHANTVYGKLLNEIKYTGTCGQIKFVYIFIFKVKAATHHLHVLHEVTFSARSKTYLMMHTVSEFKVRLGVPNLVLFSIGMVI